MNNLERLEKIIEVLDNYRAQLIVDGHDYWADKIGLMADEAMWLYRDMSEFK